MKDVIVSVGINRPGDEQRLANAIQTYTQWRKIICDVEARVPDDEAPDIMVKTGFRPNGDILKTLIFQDRRWAAAFLKIWRHERRRVLEIA